MADDDGDHDGNPAILAQFRNTAGAPLRFEAPVFNEEPFDIQGLQYAEALSVPGDVLDVVAFGIVPGEVDPTIRITLDCDRDESSRLRATLVRDDTEVLDTIVCADGPVDILLDGADSFDDYTVEVELDDGEDVYTDYELSIDGFCFQDCDYTTYVP